MKIAVIGAGAWGKNIVKTLYALDSLESVTELDPTLRETIKASYPGIQIIDSIQALVNSPVPAVVIATPVPTHFAIAKQLLLAGKDVFIEKPMTLVVSEAAELVTLAKQNKRILMVGHLLLYQPAIQYIKKILAQKELLGDLCFIQQRRLGLGRVRKVENVLWSQGVHDIAVQLFLLGQVPRKIEVNGQSILQSSIEDDIHLHLEFDGNLQTHLHCCWLWPQKERNLVAVGTKAMLAYNEIDQTVTLIRKSINPDLSNADAGSELLFKGDGEPLKLELLHFLDRIKTRQQPISDGYNGLEVVKILQTATEKMKS